MFNQPGIVAVAGSRNISASSSVLIVQTTSALAADGFSFVVGCCSGADAALLSAVPRVIPPSFIQCFAAFNADGMGLAPSSAIDQVVKFSHSGGCVKWLAGGSLSIPPWVRLANRTKQVVHSANAGLLVFFSSPRSRGSLLACRCAISRGIPIMAFPMGFSSTELPNLGVGYWIKNTNNKGCSWIRNQQDIFYN